MFTWWIVWYLTFSLMQYQANVLCNACSSISIFTRRKIINMYIVCSSCTVSTALSILIWNWSRLKCVLRIELPLCKFCSDRLRKCVQIIAKNVSERVFWNFPLFLPKYCYLIDRYRISFGITLSRVARDHISASLSETKSLSDLHQEPWSSNFCRAHFMLFGLLKVDIYSNVILVVDFLRFNGLSDFI